MLFVPKSNGLLMFYKQNIDNKLFFVSKGSVQTILLCMLTGNLLSVPNRSESLSNRPKAAVLKGFKRKKPRRICIPHVNVVKCICYANYNFREMTSLIAYSKK